MLNPATPLMYRQLAVSTHSPVEQSVPVILQLYDSSFKKAAACSQVATPPANAEAVVRIEAKTNKLSVHFDFIYRSPQLRIGETDFYLKDSFENRNCLVKELAGFFCSRMFAFFSSLFLNGWFFSHSIFIVGMRVLNLVN